MLREQGLRRQHMLDLAGADAEGKRAERAMGGGVAVAAHDGRAGQGPALFRADDVYDALADIVHRQIFDAELARVGLELRDLFARFRIGDAQRAVLGRHIVIGDGQRQIGAARLAMRVAQTFERLRAGDFVHEMAVDIKHRRFTRRFMHQMCVPDLVVESSRRCHDGHTCVQFRGCRISLNGRLASGTAAAA